MPSVDLGDLAAVGLISDTPSAEIPPNAFSRANNTAFRGRSVTRSGVFSALPVTYNAGTYGDPIKLFRLLSPSGLERLFFITTKGYIYETDGNTVTDRTVAGWSAVTSVTRKSAASLAGLAYFSGEDVPIQGLGVAATQFAPVMAGTIWDGSKWKVIRPFDGRLMAFNGTLSSNNYRQRVIWSDPVDNESLATGWDTASLSTSAGWVDLTALNSEILDAQPLNDQMIVYGAQGVARLWPSGDDFVFNNEMIITDDGVLAQGCVATIPEYGHFVVGRNTIYLFDGHTKHDIAVDRVERLFRTTISSEDTWKTFVVHDRASKEVLICYVTTAGGDDTAYPDTEWPNKALVWNYSRGGMGVWSTRDMPNVVDSSLFGYTTGALTWADMESETFTWDTIGGTWALIQGQTTEYPLYYGRAMTVDIDGTPTSVPSRLMVYTPFFYDFAESDAGRNNGRFLLEHENMTIDAVSPWTTKLFDKVAINNNVRDGEPLNVEGLARMHTNTPLFSTGELAYDTQETPYLNFRVTGRFVGYRIWADPNRPVDITRITVQINKIGDI